MKINTKKDRRERIILHTQTDHRNGRSAVLRVFRSVSHIYAQVIDDMAGTTLASASSMEPTLKGQLSGPARPGNRAERRCLARRSPSA